MQVEYSLNDSLSQAEVVELYAANAWSSAKKPRELLAALQKYAGIHQQMLTADGDAVPFYETLGFKKAGKTVGMWIYDGNEH